MADLASDVTAIAAGTTHNCALTNGGGLKCWGSGSEGGQLGQEGTTGAANVPVDVSGLASGVAGIVGRRQAITCAVTTAGAAKCWGWNAAGQLGDGTTEDSHTPVDVDGLSALLFALATFSTDALSVAAHSITAVYPGDTNHEGSTSDAVIQEVEQSATATALQSSNASSVFGQSVTFTATVSATAPGAGTPTGTVQFKRNGTDIGGQRTLNGSGVATFATDELAVGGHTITAVYEGDASFTTSTSADLTQTVELAQTNTELELSDNPTVFGQSVTFTATVSVTAPGAGTPTGTVTFKDGATTIGADLVSGTGNGHP